MTARTTNQIKKTDDTVTFSVPEFVAYERTLAWFAIFFILFALAVVLSAYSHDVFLLIIVILGSVVFYQLTLAQPTTSKFLISPQGVTFKQKEYPWNTFQSFSLYERDNYAILHLEPLGNSNSIIVPIPRTQHKEELVHILRSIIPQRLHPRATFGDWLLGFTRF
ncbi:hypothetical protein GW889_01040 [Candidatus Berkelbacteria bacterium]|nr:hypothetical protein [Candidatus Berkelbacteria bacterium]